MRKIQNFTLKQDIFAFFKEKKPQLNKIELSQLKSSVLLKLLIFALTIIKTFSYATCTSHLLSA